MNLHRSRSTARRGMLAALVGCGLLMAAPPVIAHASGPPKGTLTQIQCVEDPEAPTTVGCDVATAEGLDGGFGSVVSPDGRSVYVSGSNDDAITVFSRNSTTGKLTFVECHTHVVAPDTAGCIDDRALDRIAVLRVSLDGKNLYGVSQFSDAIVAYSRSTTTGKLTQLAGAGGCIQNNALLPGPSAPGATEGCAQYHSLDTPRDIAISLLGENVYVVSQDDSALITLARNRTTGVLSPQACIANNNLLPQNTSCADGRGMDSTRGLVMSLLGENMYTTAQGTDVVPQQGASAVASFRRNVFTGAVTQLSGTDGCIQDNSVSVLLADGCATGKGIRTALGIAISPLSRHLYVTSREDDGVAVLTRDLWTGKLSQSTGLDACVSETGTAGQCTIGKSLDQPFTVVVSWDGENVYVAARSSRAVSVFSRNLSNGTITQLPGTAGCISDNGASTPPAQPAGLPGGCTDGAALEDAAGLSLSLDGKNVYVADGPAGTPSTSDAIVTFTRQS